MAGLLGALADLGASVSVLCATARAGSTRHGELLQAARALGLRPDAVFTGELEDGALPDGDAPRALEAAIRTAIDQTDATALIALGPEGGYGHRDHIAVWRAVEAVWRSLPSPMIPVAFPTFPPGLFGPLRAWLNRARPELLDASPPTPPPVAGTAHLSLASALGLRKRAALEAHRSQLPRGGADAFLGPGVGRRLLEAEDWALVRSPDAASIEETA